MAVPMSARKGSSITSYSFGTTSFLAIVEGRGQARGEVGIAVLDLHVTKFTISQFSDSLNYPKVLSKLNVFSPKEILMPATICDVSGQASRLHELIKKEFPETTIVPLQRRIFNEAAGLQKLQHLIHEEYNSIIYTISEKYYGLAAAAALLKYIELTRNIIFPPKVMKVEFQLAENTVMIDRPTAQHLELLQNNAVSSSSSSLFGVINYCKTPGGIRNLRTNILQPPCDIKLIARRLDCIQELRNNPVMLYDIMHALNQLPHDLEHVIATLIQIPKVDSTRVMEQRINYIIFLKQLLSVIPSFVGVLQNSKHEYFRSVRTDFSNLTFAAMLQKIQAIISEEARLTKGSIAMRTQRSYAVNPEINPLLDVARRALQELQNDTDKYVATLAAEHSLNLRLLENSSRGFYIQFIIPTDRGSSEIPPLPATFLHVVKKKNVVTFTTEALLLAEQRAKHILSEIHNISNLIVSELVTQIRQDIGSLYKVSDAISELDVLYSLTTYSTYITRVARPEFSPIIMSISMGRHPILEAISATPPVANDIFMSHDTNIALITGPNMSGKTTFLKQMATLQILAQMGSFVPADSATFKLVTQIFSRLGNADNIEAHASSFALEITEMHYILGNMTNRSLVIVDELGRSTRTEEGAALSYALIEGMRKVKGLLVFSTHYRSLARLESMYPDIVNYKLETLENFVENNEENNASSTLYPQSDRFPTSKLDYTHVLKRGVTEVENYGLKLAKYSSIPQSVIKEATICANQIVSSRKQRAAGNEDMETDSEEPYNRARYFLSNHLYNLRPPSNGMSRHHFNNYFQNLRDEFITTFIG